ncbi:YihY/virulence factor BrkB family protein [Aurantibacillus circumpalustris]|uniref:YihY/virulence factor BrkB family protein n=1 Tax=Aurantibacillus circumpalustris TaxID=3036359 RepID=UPI00295A7E0F|nr:YihY/virulence factor BrkB family protein [Aurantibacillus circumpalustris]
MAKIISLIKQSVEFVSERLWKVRLSKVDKRQGLLIKQIRIFALAFKGFMEDKCFTYSTALTFYTLFSIVPVLALIFAIAKGFGFEKNLQEQILQNYSEYSDILTNAFVYANSMLSNAKGGVIAGFGIVLLLWSVMQLLVNIETSFNDVWDVKQGRNWIRKITDYLTIMLVGPLLLIVSGGISIAIQTQIGNMHLLGFIATFFVNLLAYGLIVGVFTFLYRVMPNTKVKIKPAFIAAIIATLLFEFVAWGYIRFQVGANRLNAIYGGFAALPLFLIWVQYSWYIVLFGAELSYAYQNVDRFELEDEIEKLSPRYKKVISLMIANLVTKGFYNNEKALSVHEISEKLDLPSHLTRNVLNEFVETQLFVEVVSEKEDEILYLPGVTESKFTVQFLIDSLETKGLNSLPINDTKELIHINNLMIEMDKSMDTALGHMNVKDIVI